MGKIFHPGAASGHDDPPSRSEPYFHAPNLNYWDNKNISHRAVPKTEYSQKSLPDMQIADHAIKVLRNASEKALSGDRPFFVAVGFHRPHLPFVIEEFLNYYPESDIKIPDNEFAPVNMPDVAWSDYGELRTYNDISKGKFSGRINSTLPDKLVKDLRRYYYAAVSYTDFHVGKVLQVRLQSFSQKLHFCRTE